MGMGEILLILLVALIVLGPQHLSRGALTVGKWVKRVQHFSNDFHQTVTQQIELEAQLKENEAKAAEVEGAISRNGTNTKSR